MAATAVGEEETSQGLRMTNHAQHAVCGMSHGTTVLLTPMLTCTDLLEVTQLGHLCGYAAQQVVAQPPAQFQRTFTTHETPVARWKTRPPRYTTMLCVAVHTQDVHAHPRSLKFAVQLALLTVSAAAAGFQPLVAAHGAHCC
jgi:hypothetical protein